KHDQTQIENLWNAAKDLDLINLVLLVSLNPESAGIPEGEKPWNAVRREPWQYKPL
ncbi:MAG: hypothetical protein QOF34_1057, partial [Sphingomonadales bacterium]|nr:hypothetical protein [Sphingomonadales bacterium]